MKLNEIPKEELELMGYDDIAALVLQESGKKMKLRDIFKKVCEVLELPEEVVDERLVDFFELMSINKKFIMLKNGYWDLQSKHKLDIVIEEDEDDEEELIDEELEEENELELEEEDEDLFYDKDDDDDDVVDDDDLSDFVVIDDPEDESNL